MSGPGATAARPRYFGQGPKERRRLDQAGARISPSRNNLDTGLARSEIARTPARRKNGLRQKLERNLFPVSAAVFVVGLAGWSLLIYHQFHSANPVAPALTAYTMTVAAKTDLSLGKSDSFGTSIYVRSNYPQMPAAPRRSLAATESAASIVAREWGSFASIGIAGSAHQPRRAMAKATSMKPSLRLASLESAAPFRATDAIPSRIRPHIGAETALVDFETAPFPYHGMIPGLNRPFLNVGQAGHRGHTNFRGQVFWEDQTFSDDRVLLHIPPGFDPTQPAVMVVFFHGHGATLARDVRDRQQVPAQLTASGANAVLVAPQFAVDAADSSAGKFWEPDGFKRFLDEAAVKLARLYGDPRRARTFAKMPIVIVAYSGGFGPTLSVLDRGGVRSRVRGIVLLDALYAGIGTFADWIANNRFTFFVSSYTPHTAHHNADLEHLLRERSVPYTAELRKGHLQGMVAFLPAGDVSHRDFVTHAWADNPIKDILKRMDNVEAKTETAGTTSPSLYAARN